MKKTIALILILSVLCVFASCAKSPAGSTETADAQSTTAAQTPTPYEEFDALVQPDSVIADITKTGSSSSKVNDELTSTEYRYNDASAEKTGFRAYVDYLKNSSLTVREESDGSISLLLDGKKCATITKTDAGFTVRIIPENKRVKAVEKKVSLGSTEALDFVEFTFEKTEIGDEVYPEDTSGVYLYDQDAEGYKYVTLRGKIKNTGTENLDSRYVNALLTINDTYKYDCEIIFGSNPSALTDYAIAPFETSPLYFIANVPDEAVEKMETAYFSIQFNDQFESGGEEYTYTFTLDMQ